jgi:GxxExxY protein
MDTPRSTLLSSLFEEGKDAPSDELTEKIIGCAFTVSNTLGAGYLEKVYENALAHELRKAGLTVEQQKRVEVFYDGVMVGYFDSDIIVEEIVILEIKAVRALDDAHKAQTLNYLKSTGLRVGLVINFGRPKIEIKRVAL